MIGLVVGVAQPKASGCIWRLASNCLRIQSRDSEELAKKHVEVPTCGPRARKRTHNSQSGRDHFLNSKEGCTSVLLRLVSSPKALEQEPLAVDLALMMLKAFEDKDARPTTEELNQVRTLTCIPFDILPTA